MAEGSMLWQTGTTGDGALAGYTQDQVTALFQRTFISDVTTEGILKGYENELEPTSHAGDPKVTIDTGAAWVCGFHYWNDTLVDVPLTLPVVGDTGFRVVLRVSYGTTRTVRVALLQSADGVPAIPALTQNAGVQWEISLCSGVVDVRGDIWSDASKTVAGVTDLRKYCHPNIEVIPTMIANRTRTFFVPANGAYNSNGNLTNCAPQGWLLEDGDLCVACGMFTVPNDFVSGSSIKVTAVVVPFKAGNLYAVNTCCYGSCGEDWTTHNDRNSGVVAVDKDKLKCLLEVPLTKAAIGDIVCLSFERYGDDPLDTINDVVYMTGWLVEYLADS